METTVDIEEDCKKNVSLVYVADDWSWLVI